MDNLIAFAMLFAEECHRGQSRRYEVEPYIAHPRRVAAAAARLGLHRDAIAAAFLHDVVEDCEVNPSEIFTIFGERVHKLVMGLTDLQTSEDGNRAKRSAKVIEDVGKSNDMVLQTLKILDVVDNARTIAGNDPKFWKTVKEESKALYNACTAADFRARRKLKKLLD